MPPHLKIAVIGSGPSGFYAAEHLLKNKDITVQVDIFDKEPTPFGLVRTGIAPDHLKIKQIVRNFEKIANSPNLRFFGNVELGKDILMDELRQMYHSVILATGAHQSRPLGIPNEEKVCQSLRVIRSWNDIESVNPIKCILNSEEIVLIGNGNVSLDVARILLKSREELRSSELSEKVLDVLDSYHVKKIKIIARRGPVQAACSNKELQELVELHDVSVYVNPNDLVFDQADQELIEADTSLQRKVDLFKSYSESREVKEKQIEFHFCLTPKSLQLDDNGRITGLVCIKNTKEGSSFIPSNDTVEISCNSVVNCSGFVSQEIPGIPFDNRTKRFPSADGKIIGLDGLYVTGWSKKTTGVVVKCKSCAKETVNTMLNDLPNLPKPSNVDVDVESLLLQRSVSFVTFDQWRVIDKIETDLGKAVGKPRVKMSRDEVLAKLSEL
ncbi:hypothetical protein GEMRC1_012111 [Eukaryota sp. GEM-RC1]